MNLLFDFSFFMRLIWPCFQLKTKLCVGFWCRSACIHSAQKVFSSPFSLTMITIQSTKRLKTYHASCFKNLSFQFSSERDENLFKYHKVFNFIRGQFRLFRQNFSCFYLSICTKYYHFNLVSHILSWSAVFSLLKRVLSLLWLRSGWSKRI